jgi:pimeloyl-ACP methyl ester carboxylesterase
VQSGEGVCLRYLRLRHLEDADGFLTDEWTQGILVVVALPFDEAGSGPPVVLLHAGLADRSMWTEHLEALADAGHRALAMDIPGFGEAALTPGEQAPWTDVLQTMDALSIERAALVGNSFGAALALRIAVVAPDRVTALVLVSSPPPGLEPSAELAQAWQAEESALERGDLDAAVAAVVDAWTLPDAPRDLRDRVAAMQRRAFDRQAEVTEVSEAPDPVEQDPDLLARLDVPALVVAGEHDMPDFRDGAELLARTLPHARHVIVEGAGHLAPLERPDAFRELMLDFLRCSALPHPPTAPI